MQALVNTLNRHTGEDLLGTPASASGWLATAGLLPGGAPVSGAERGALAELREAIRAVLAAHAHESGSAEPAARLNLALLPGRLAVTVDPSGGIRLASADDHPYARVVGAIAATIAGAGASGTWARLKCCPGSRCGWAFYDASAAGRSRWCAMQLCGSRAKMRAYRSRQAG